MVSPEVLRRYPIFSLLNDNQLRGIAMITEEKSYKKDEEIFQEGKPAYKLYVLIEGEVDLLYSGSGEGAITNAHVGTITPGDVYGISAMLEPYRYKATGKCAKDCKTIEIDANALRALSEVDHTLGYYLMRNLLYAAIERLNYARIELAAARH
jgi:CRP-like cAMP-binding protein